MIDVKSNTTVSIPADLKKQAIIRGISFSEILVEALKEKIEALEREGDQPCPAPKHPEASTTEVNSC